VSRTQDLVLQIKQITVEIRDIKKRKKEKHFKFKGRTSTFRTRNHTGNDPLQEGHVKHDEGDVHYEDNEQNVHLVPDNMNILEHCVPTQYPSPVEPIISPPPCPEPHPSSLDNGTPEEIPSRKLRWSKSPNGPESPGIVEGNADEESDLPWSNTKPS